MDDETAAAAEVDAAAAVVGAMAVEDAARITSLVTATVESKEVLVDMTTEAVERDVVNAS